VSEELEIILGIEEYEEPSDYEKDRYSSEAGFRITTNQQVITLAIDNDSSCCETWGYLMSEDDPEKFINTDLLGIEITDINRVGHRFVVGYEDGYEPESDDIHLDSGDTLFVDIQTTMGTLQFVAYNCHNGYYGHSVRVESKQLKHEGVL
jgi:hypothetical protein